MKKQKKRRKVLQLMQREPEKPDHSVRQKTRVRLCKQAVTVIGSIIQETKRRDIKHLVSMAAERMERHLVRGLDVVRRAIRTGQISQSEERKHLDALEFWKREKPRDVLLDAARKARRKH